MNDTSVYGMWWDSYPYSATSVFALHPMYLSLPALFASPPSTELAAIMAAAKKAGEAREDVDYDATVATKLEVAKAVFASPQGRACGPLPPCWNIDVHSELHTSMLRS